MQKSRINERIIATKVRLILVDGTNQGEISKNQALLLARQQNLDLVEVSPGPVPICKLMDYGKFLYEKSKSEKHNKSPSDKEISIGYSIGDHDLEVKKKKIIELLTKGHKVFFSMKLRGREKAMRPLAKEKFISIVTSLVQDFKMADIKSSEQGFMSILFPNKLKTA
jgi:translation initiation factor IF-3